MAIRWLLLASACALLVAGLGPAVVDGQGAPLPEPVKLVPKGQPVCQTSDASGETACALGVLRTWGVACSGAGTTYECRLQVKLELELVSSEATEDGACAWARSDAIPGVSRVCGGPLGNASPERVTRVYSFFPRGGTTVLFTNEVCISLRDAEAPSCATWRVSEYFPTSPEACGFCGDQIGRWTGPATGPAYTGPRHYQGEHINVSMPPGLQACTATQGGAGCAELIAHPGDTECTGAPSGEECRLSFTFDVNMAGLVCTYVATAERDPWRSGCAAGGLNELTTEPLEFTYASSDLEEQGWLPVSAIACLGESRAPRTGGATGTHHHCFVWSPLWIEPS